MVNKKLDLIRKRVYLNKENEEKIKRVLIELYNKNILNKVNDEILDLIGKILDNEDNIINEDDLDYFSILLRTILLPFNKNKVEKKSDLPAFLKEFDKLINIMSISLQEVDLKILGKYNDELANVIRKFQEIIDIFEFSDLCRYGNISDNKIITSTLSHLAVILYLSLDNYDYEYDLLERVFVNIISNYTEFLYDTRASLYFVEDNKLEINNYQILKDFTLCTNLLRREFCPPVKILK